MHLFFSIADTRKHIGSEVVVLHFFNALFNHFAQVESLGASRLGREEVKPLLGFWSQTNGSSHVKTFFEYMYSMYHTGFILAKCGVTTSGYSSEITRHGKPVAMVVPVQDWQAAQGRQVASGGILALRGSGRGLWPQGAAKAVAQLRNEWQD